MNSEYLEMPLIEARGGHTHRLKMTSNSFVGIGPKLDPDPP
jgi:hypothetical protein